MKNPRIKPTWAALLFVCACFDPDARADDPLLLHVAPNGRDDWSGKLAAPNAAGSDGPLATVRRARDLLRRLKPKTGGALKTPVTVLIRGGTYFLEEPLVFAPEDSGTDDGPVLYAAYPNEKPVLSGGRRITGWRAVKTDPSLWIADVPDAKNEKWFFRELWVNGQRAVRARHPNRGYFKIAAVPDALPETPWTDGQARFQFASGDLKNLSAAQTAELTVMTRWVESHMPVESIDEAARAVMCRKRSVFKLDPGDLYYAEHALEFLDAPGEWFLDAAAGTLYYRPRPGENLEQAEIIAPRLAQIVRLAGEPEKGRFVENLVFRGIAFSNAEWWFPKDFQSPWPKPDLWGFPQAAVGVPGALYGEGVRNVTLKNCAIAHVGGYALELARGCRNNRVLQCELTDLGAGGVKIGEPVLRENAAEQTHANEISDCRICDGGRVFHQAVGVWIGQSFDNRIAHNLICDFYYTGISCGWTWGYGPALAKGNVFEFNHVHHVGVLSNGDGPILSDMGGIYTLGAQPGTVVRNNFFHDIQGLRYGGWGIYFDEGSAGIVAENNIVARTTHGGFHQHYGKENIVRNNVFAFARDHQIQRTRPEPHRSFSFERNIVYWKEGALLAGDWSGDGYAFDRNLYWPAGAPASAIRFGPQSFEEWRGRGLDKESLIADPLFVDGEKDDFRLKPGSPALRLGFQSIDARLIGPHGAP